MFNYIRNILSEKCPRCHKGEMFTHKWYQLGSNNKMVESCKVCGQRTQLEPGFYHGTGYVSYALTVGFSIVTFVAWIASTGIGIRDSRIFYWLILNVVLLILLQPFFMRWLRLLWLSWFFHDDDKYHTPEPLTVKVPSEN
ncbi:DUF983 domain-containing protein [Flavobacterium sp. BFFFF1]|uniref:DUF983 domain-containing protein n=1 Tax=Flavobacterium sp. BFFFF1 TaxID=2015557 RepID=UPI0025BD35FA|nr:DUF983 domain-containing protein [Flavobacterium sp. BFFFF1]